VMGGEWVWWNGVALGPINPGAQSGQRWDDYGSTAFSEEQEVT